jgi:hypothetical protein
MRVSARSNPVRVRDVLIAAVPDLKNRLLEETIKTDWSRLIGPQLGQRSRPGRLHAGVLEVIVDNSPCLLELTLRGSELLAALRRRFEAVSALRFSLGVLPSVREPAAPSRARPEARERPSAEELGAIEAMTASLPDPVLAGSLRQLLTKDLLARRQRDAHRRCEDSTPAERED